MHDTDGLNRERESTEAGPLEDMHPSDMAAAIEALAPAEGAELLESLSPAAAADALEQMDDVRAQAYVEELTTESAAEALAHMAPDDAADILAELPDEQRDQILDSLPSQERGELVELMKYPPESAGGVMSPQVTALLAGMSVVQAIAALRELATRSEQIYYTYVVDQENRLVGVLSLRDLLLASDQARLRDIMIRNVTSVPATMDREQVAALLGKQGYLALPVVDAEGRLLGIVTVDDVVDILQNEATEDMQRMVGAGGDERVDSPVRLSLQRRLPWLLLNLGTAFMAACIVGLFERSLAEITALAILMPVVAGMAGNTGAQSMAVMVRGLAIGEARAAALGRLMVRQVCIGGGTGAAVGAVAAACIFWWWGDLALSAALGLGLTICMVIATLAGALVPWLMKRLGFDPAQSSSIILTTITDICGFGIFLTLGTWILALRGGR